MAGMRVKILNLNPALFQLNILRIEEEFDGLRPSYFAGFRWHGGLTHSP
jgi:hypothetical protein